MIRKYSRRLVLVLLLVGVAISVVAGAGSAPRREITLVARNMAFYMPGEPTPNPDLILRPRERVKLTLINRDAGVGHDFAVVLLGVYTGVVAGDGSSRWLEFQAPDEPGRYDYVCSLHARMMRGVLEVR